MALAAATGFFDGVHSGHRAVLREIRRIASERGLESAIITFWPHPRFVLDQDTGNLHLLNTLEEKKTLLKGLGIDRVHVIPFTAGLSRMAAAEFITEYLSGTYDVDTMVVGYDHRLGCENVAGERLASLIVECGLNVSMVKESEAAGSHVSSTVIRRLLEKGEVKKASRLLGYDYFLRYGDFLSGEKVRPGDGKYLISLRENGRTTQSECMLNSDRITLAGDGRCLTEDVQITFLEKMF